jgi:alpha-amylase
MNVLSDFIVRVEEQYPTQIENEELNALLTTIRNQAEEIQQLEKELKSARNEKLSAKKAKAPKAAPAKVEVACGEVVVAEEKPKRTCKRTTKK